MAIFSVSDLVISITLLLNALALISNRIKPGSLGDRRPKPSLSLLGIWPTGFATENSSSAQNAGINESDGLLSSENNHSPRGDVAASFVDRVRTVFYKVRKLSCIILFWNLIFTVLMILVFPA
jgi:hypothetical protein